MHTVIVGGGFAGITAALEISKRQLGKITLISDQPYFLHHATLYATATGRSVNESVISLQDIFADHHDVTVVEDTVVDIDGEKHLAIGSSKQKYAYDNLVVAIGVVTTYFGINGMADHSFGIKTLKEVNAFKEHIKGEVLADKHFDKNYVVIGAGPTGVELAGALQSYLHELKDRYLTKGTVKITLVEAAPKILPRSSNTASAKVQKRLEKLGVKVLVNHKVESIDDENIIIEGKKVPTKTAIWTSGVANHPFFATKPELFTLLDRGPMPVIVDDHMQAFKDIYVIGDNAAVPNAGVAWTAIRSARFIADHLARKITQRPFKKYRYPKPSESFPIGDGWAYTEWRNIYATGRTGYVLRRLTELKNYRALLPYDQAIAAWRSHSVRETE
ncbi:MAG: FAD-binding protein [Chloroflexi bacterium]|nr:MAG: FAD-binding protein [Chloroflexota bacterium]